MESREEALLRTIKEMFREEGRKGGLARAAKLSPEERRKSALKASKAAAKVRKERAATRRNLAKLEKITARIAAGSKALEKKVLEAKARKARAKTKKKEPPATTS